MTLHYILRLHDLWQGDKQKGEKKREVVFQEINEA